jgi:O-antigen/teichoic acid export membrane protein
MFRDQFPYLVMDKKFKMNFIKGSAAATIGTVSSMFFHFLSIMIITRFIPREEFGIYAIILVIVHLFNLLSGLGLEFTLVRQIAGDNETERKNILFPVLVMRSIQLLLITVLFYFFSGLILPLFAEGINYYIFQITVLFALTNFRDLFYNLLQGLNYFKRFASVQVTSAIIRVALIGAIVIWDTLSLGNLILIEIVTTAMAFVLQIFMVPMKQLINFSSNLDVYKKILKFSFPLYLNNLLTFTYDRVHFFILAIYLNPVSVALYDVANKIPDALKRIFQSFIIVFFPNISKLFTRGDIIGGESLMIKSLSLFSTIVVFGVLISFLFSREITVILFSANYIESATAFALLMLVFYLRVVSNIMGYTLVSAGYSSVPVKTNSVSSIASVGGSLLLIPMLGFIGAVYALLAMNIITQAYYHYYLKKAGIRRGTVEYLKPALIGLILYILYLIQPFQSIPVKTFFVLLYPLMGWFFIPEVKKITGFFSDIRPGTISN